MRLTKDITPIFIFSLPRSGSTMAQRVIAAHPSIATTSETWILLPYLYTLNPNGIYAEYGHKASVSAIQDFCRELPNGTDDYLEEMRAFVTRLYRKAAKSDVPYFLEKTPRNNLVIDHILQLFPDAKFIFLWRNPLAVAASIIETFGRGKWQLYDYKVDLFDGLANMVDAYQKYPDKIHAVRFEDLVANPEEAWKALFDYLQLPFQSEMLSSFSEVKLKGRMGDPTGTKRYQTLSTEPLEKWKQTLANPLRKAWCRRYLNWIGADRLAAMGYDQNCLHKELDGIPSRMRNIGSDLLRISYGGVNCLFELRIIKRKLGNLPNWNRIHSHT